MGQITLLEATLANRAETTVTADASRYRFITISADGLAGAETVAIKAVAGGTPVVVADPSTSAAMTLTASRPALTLAGGVVYRLTKALTTGNCGLYMDTGPGI